MSDARSWARLGGWMGIAWPVLFIVIMMIAGMVGPEAHSSSQELSALGQPRFGHLKLC